jgi:hypothetical protein
MRQYLYSMGKQARLIWRQAMFQCTAFDGSNIPRVYGRHDNTDVAETYCRDELIEYLKRRREMRADEFHFELRREGERVWGLRWQTPLARSLRVSDRTVHRWISGDVPIKPWLLEWLKVQPTKARRQKEGDHVG